MKLEVLKFIKNILFPIFCVECQKEGEWWCAECRARREGKTVRLSFDSADSPLDGLTALLNYQDGSSIARLIQLFKYHYAVDIAELWKKIIHDAGKFSLVGTVMPVPLYIRRERERGYNQANLIARIMAAENNWQVDSISLARIRATRQQAHLSREERIINVRDAFVWRGSSSAPEQVILVDDVYTTGSTMRECAKALKASGAKQVYGLVLAHG